MMSVRSRLLVSTIVSGAFLLPLSVSAADLIDKAPPPSIFAPAVDGINSKFDAFGGSLGHQSFYGGRGSVSVPVSGQWGAQLDLMGGGLGGDAFAAFSGHLFWRDPNRGLLGLYVSHTRWDRFDGVYVTQIAPEFEAYWHRWTLQGIAGIEFGNSGIANSPSVTIPPFRNIPGTMFFDTFDVKTRFFDEINLKYYFTDNWEGYVGHRYLGGKNALALGTEYGLPLRQGAMASAFVEARLGSDSFQGLWGGLRVYFGGKDKPLIARHRQDDPITWDVDSLFSIINNTHSNSSSQQFCSNGRPPPFNGFCGEPS
jgi:hypothetical protein